MYENIYGLKWTEDKIKVMCGNYKPTFFYESNMTTTPYYGRLGQAVTMTDYMATAMEWGSVAPCIYGLVGNEWQIVRAGKNNKKLPLYLSAQLYNRFCRGMVLSCPVASRASLVNAVGTKFPLEPIGSHFYTSGDTFTILLMSRDFENDFVTQLHFEVSVPANTVARKFVMSGSDFSTCDATIDSSELPLTNGMLVTVPKYGIVLITFKAASLNLQPLPFGCFDPTRKIGVGVREPVTPGKKRQFIR